MADIRIAVAGAAGRMGRQVVAAVAGRDGCRLVGGWDRPDHPDAGADLGTLAGLAPIGLDLATEPATEGSDVIVDFSSPAALVDLLSRIRRDGPALVSGTTGLSASEQAEVAKAAAHVPIVQAGNFSLGVNLLLGLTRRAAAALGADFDIEIVEMHHRHKVDAPSGTALMLGEAVALGRGVDLSERTVSGGTDRSGARAPGAIGFAALRGGGVIGEHAVIFAGESERIELSHKAEDRSLFAKGAVRAGLWAAAPDRSPGLYGMTDVLGLDGLEGG